MRPLDPRPGLLAPRPFVDRDDVDEVSRALERGATAGSEYLERFEERLSRATGARRALGVATGGVARHLLFHALGIGPGRRVLVPALAPAGLVMGVQHCGGEVEFVDVDPATGNLDVPGLEARLAEGPVPAAVVVVHFAGLPCDMEWLFALRRRYDFALVEDAAYAFGARYRIGERWYRVGEHPDVTACVLSFRCDQVITTGEGAALLTADGGLAERLERLRGAPCEPGARFRESAPMDRLGFEARLSEPLAALGTRQLEKLPDLLAARREIALRYLGALRDYELFPPGGRDREHAWGAFGLRTREDELEPLRGFLREHGLRVGGLFAALPELPWFRARSEGRPFPGAAALARRTLTLPVEPVLSEADQERVVDALADWRRSLRAA